jgi:ubiquinone/menaquinone biosynthesis C-methylase UbiE
MVAGAAAAARPAAVSLAASVPSASPSVAGGGAREPDRHRLEWDYTRLADSYVRRPDYAGDAIDALLALVGPGAGRSVIDLGAGAGHLTAALAERGCKVLALEPNAAMRRHGVARTNRYADVRWIVGRMESTGLPAEAFSLATCGSSFGVVDRGETLREVARILEPCGWFACMWNHRDLEDPLQREIEAHIAASIPGFAYGTRREDQTAVIAASGLFGEVHTIESPILHRLPTGEWVEAWRSHATLQRQAGDRFDAIVEGIAAIVAARCGEVAEVPYTTRVWAARLRTT